MFSIVDFTNLCSHPRAGREIRPGPSGLQGERSLQEGLFQPVKG